MTFQLQICLQKLTERLEFSMPQIKVEALFELGCVVL